MPWTVPTRSLANARLCAALLFFAALCACGPAEVQVQGNFPSPVVNQLPLELGLWYAPEFRAHEFRDEAKAPGDSEWVVATGEAQVEMWDTLFAGMFTHTEHLQTEPGSAQEDQESPTENRANLDGVLIPIVDELQYAIPTHTNIKVYEIWMRYRFRLVSPEGDPIAEWKMSSYGKTPTAFLQSDEQAVNLAAVMALRDAGANFATNFTRVPALEEWLREKGITNAQKEVP